MDEANIKENKFKIKITEWEQDTLLKAIEACRFPGTHVELIVKLKDKIAGAIEIKKE
jgi:hypothetical protein